MDARADAAAVATRIRSGDRAALARAITLIESKKAAHRAQAGELLRALMPATGKAMRVGITGVPGVGKSTTIDALGSRLISGGHRVAVLAVDPSSVRSGGSILGDKTRMPRLFAAERARVRAPRRRPGLSAASLPARGSRSCCARPRATTWCWWKPSAPANRRWRWRR